MNAVNPAARRRKSSKGVWMLLRDPELLVSYMEHADMSQARLGRFAETSRQFIHLLATGQRRTCTPIVAARIEEAVRVLPGTLFVEQKSHTMQRPHAKRGSSNRRSA